jgi:hypothetical protein
VSELVDRRISHSQEAVREGDILPLRIIRIERDRHRLGLSLKQARDMGERMGFTFTPDGEVITVPPDIKERFRDEINSLLGEGAADIIREAPEPRQQPAETPPSSSARDDGTEDDTPAMPITKTRDDEEDLPQTQMAAAFAAANLENLASEPPPEETKA